MVDLIGVPVLLDGQILYCALDSSKKWTQGLSVINYKVGLKVRFEDQGTYLFEVQETEEEIALANARVKLLLVQE